MIYKIGICEMELPQNCLRLLKRSPNVTLYTPSTTWKFLTYVIILT